MLTSENKMTLKYLLHLSYLFILCMGFVTKTKTKQKQSYSNGFSSINHKIARTLIMVDRLK